MIDDETANAPPRGWVWLRDTWPRANTWLGSVAEALYIVWLTSAPVWRTITWLEFGGVLLALFAAKGVLLRIARLDVADDVPLADSRGPESRYRPLTYFFHRNYALHAGGFVALMGADTIGAIFLMGLGAAADWLRESYIRDRSEREPTEAETKWVPTALGKSFLLHVTRALLVFGFLIALLWLMSPSRVYIFLVADELAKHIGHVQHSLVAHSIWMEQRGDVDGAVRFRIVLAGCLLFLLYSVLLYEKAWMKQLLFSEKIRVTVRNPVARFCFQYLLLSACYLFIAFYASRERRIVPAGSAGDVYGFSLSDAVTLIFATMAMSFVLLANLGILTIVRAGRPNSAL